MAEVNPRDELSIQSIVEFPSYATVPIKCWIDLKILAPDNFHDTRQRPTIDLVVVVDRSRSMQGNKISLVKKSLCFILSQLDKSDRLAVVVYDEKAQVIFPFTSVTSQVRDGLFVRIESVCIGKGTNICKGVLAGMKLLNGRTPTSHRQVSSLLLLSDGFPTVGVTSREGIISAIRNPSNSSLLTQFADTIFGRNQIPFLINTVGLGEKHDPNLLQSISQTGKGMFFSILKPEEISGSVAKFLGGLLSTFAQKICLNISAINGAKLERLMVRENSDYKSTQVEIEDIQLGEERDILLLLHLPTYEGGNECYVAVETKYKLQEKIVEQVTTVSVTRSGEYIFTPRAASEVSIQRNRWETIDSLRLAKEQASNEDKMAAKDTLEKCRLKIKDSTSRNAMLSKWLIEDLNRILHELNKADFDNSDSLIAACLDSHCLQRSGSIEAEGYATPAHNDMINKSGSFL